jgi:hypothetical protein
VSAAANLIALSRTAIYKTRENDAEFASQWDEAIEEGVEQLEDEARRRALHDIAEPVFYKGEECGSVRRYSDTLLIFLLKAHKPAKYKDRAEITGANGQPLIPLPDDILAALTAGYKAIATGSGQ